MRRKDREITDLRQIEEILEEAQIVRVAMSDGDSPYVVPLNYGYEPGKLFFSLRTSG